MRRSFCTGSLLAVLLFPGCNFPAAPAPGTGAEEVVQNYFEALMRQDWAAAHDRLDSGSKGRYPAAQFARLAAQYRIGLGFEPDAVHVRSCEEHGAEAVAHVVLTGTAKGQARSFKDAITQRRDGERWGVVLPPTFGHKQSR